MQVIELVGDYLVDGSIDTFSSLVRTPAIHDWLVRSAGESLDAVSIPSDFLSRLDEYQQSTLLRSVNVPEWPEGRGKDIFLSVLTKLDEWLKPLRMLNAKLTQWANPLRLVVKTIYEGVQVDRNDVAGNLSLRACGEINLALSKLAELPTNLDAQATFQ
jgi:hypothetical protein